MMRKRMCMCVCNVHCTIRMYVDFCKRVQSMFHVDVYLLMCSCVGWYVCVQRVAI